MLCNLLSLFIALNSCADREPEPEPTPTPHPTPIVYGEYRRDDGPPEEERARTSTDGVSIWEWKYERMCGCKFVREPMTEAEIEAEFNSRDAGAGEGRFIFIENRP